MAAELLKSGAMTDNIIVMPGSTRPDLLALQTVAGEFGWVVDIAHDLGEIAEAQADRKTVAAFFHRDFLGREYSWVEAIRRLRLTLPEVRVIACHGFAESIDWPELSDAGAFHALWLPLKENEVRQSLGFVWEAEKRLAACAEVPVKIAPVRRFGLGRSLRPSSRFRIGSTLGAAV
jgi:hypothetical protein